MSTKQVNSQDSSKEMVQYEEILVDNVVCNRRFHIAFETGVPNENNVSVQCPHCGVKIFESTDHPPAVLMREENLTRAPTGEEPILTKCNFMQS